MIYICIPVYNRLKYTIKCIDSILKLRDDNLKIVVCDDDSNDGTFDYLTNSYPSVIVLKGNGDLWWTGATNMCVEYVLSICNSNDFIYTLNNDTEVTESTFITLREMLLKFPNSILGSLSLFISDRSSIEVTAFKKESSSFFPKFHRPILKWGESVSNLKTKYMHVDSLSGKGVLIPVNVFKNIGIYNFDKLPHYHADTEFTGRAKLAGYDLLICFESILLSHQDLSGVGQINTKPKLKEFIGSFRTKRSSNDLTIMANRAKIIYGGSWRIYMFFNVLKISLDFAKRYLTFLLK